jgi:hypothetical protein
VLILQTVIAVVTVCYCAYFLEELVYVSTVIVMYYSLGHIKPQIFTPWKYIAVEYLKTIFCAQFVGIFIKYIPNFILMDPLNKY